MNSDQAQEPVCDYCQAPLPLGWWGRTTEPAGSEDSPLYCCLGCRMAAAIVQETGEAGAARGMLTRLGLSIFCAMNVMAFTMALWTADVYEPAGQGSPLGTVLQGLFRYVALLFSLPVLFLLGLPLASGTWQSLRRGVLSTDALLCLGVGGAFAVSFFSVFRGHGPIYFEVGCVILVMTALGRWLEATGRLKASSALDALARLLPDEVRRLDAATGAEQRIPLGDVQVGDRLRILPGERFPADGHVHDNSALVDEQVLTGESRPVLKEPGSRVFGGTLDLDGDLVVRVSAVGADGSLARLVELVKQARLAKGRYQRLVDRISSWFLPVVSGIAVLAFLLHWTLNSMEQGLLAGLAVSLIACPCALGLATPLAVWSAIGQAASQQVLFRNGEALERLAGIAAVRFDKTGTLSTGSAVVSGCVLEQPDAEDEVLARASALASCSSHVFAQAIENYSRQDDATERVPVLLRCVRAVPGHGVTGILEDGNLHTSISLGSPALMDERGLHLGPALQRAADQARGQGLSFSLVGWDGLRAGSSCSPSSGGLTASGFSTASKVPASTSASSPATTRHAAGRLPATSMSRSTRGCCRSKRWRPSDGPAPPAVRWPWSATVSTMPRRWPPATSASRWAAAPTSRVIPPQSVCWPMIWHAFPGASSWRGGPSG